MLVGVTRHPYLAITSCRLPTLVFLLLLSLPLPMATVKSLGLLSGMRPGMVGSHTPHISLEVGGSLSTLWKSGSSCLLSVVKGERGTLP